MEKTVYTNKQELINAVCREYVDFLGFDVKEFTFNEHTYDKLSKFAGKLGTLINWLDFNRNSGKYYLILHEDSSAIMEADIDKNKVTNLQSFNASTFEYYIVNGKRNICYLLDYDNLTAETVDGGDILFESTENSPV